MVSISEGVKVRQQRCASSGWMKFSSHPYNWTIGVMVNEQAFKWLREEADATLHGAQTDNTNLISHVINQNPSQTVHAFSKAYDFMDVDDIILQLRQIKVISWIFTFSLFNKNRRSGLVLGGTGKYSIHPIDYIYEPSV
ncbi:hypothetical protein DCAR_0207369 [Daucus carota subsp. sativus]|uniref:Uncharacterized protein n=1 Tax=Daucus carota subsp. sativus TaxID=79200 RepID=A0AAF0WHD6_DAUCS|nr:PREDICTED: uncharacterized protein LOC108208585 [Daucus carota subsp. sativus]WOG88135.1 hypothetical protein DCAR_0207369 [Daucus carota subsp. sativus]